MFSHLKRVARWGYKQEDWPGMMPSGGNMDRTIILKKIYRHLLHTGFLSSAGIDKKQLDEFFRELEKDSEEGKLTSTTNANSNMKKHKAGLVETCGTRLRSILKIPRCFRLQTFKRRL